MSNDQNHTTDETKSTRATRRAVLRGAGIAGLLTMGVGNASALRGGTGRTRREQAQERATGKVNDAQAYAQLKRDSARNRTQAARIRARERIPGPDEPDDPDNGNGDNDNGIGG